MIPHPKGGLQIVQKQKSLYKIRAPLCAPLIEEKEITYTKWLGVSSRTGYWKGRLIGRGESLCSENFAKFCRGS